MFGLSRNGFARGDQLDNILPKNDFRRESAPAGDWPGGIAACKGARAA
jgi:hypothetical protein